MGVRRRRAIVRLHLRAAVRPDAALGQSYGSPVATFRWPVAFLQARSLVVPAPFDERRHGQNGTSPPGAARVVTLVLFAGVAYGFTGSEAGRRSCHHALYDCPPSMEGPSLGLWPSPCAYRLDADPLKERLGSGRESFPAQPFFRAPEAFFAVFLVADAALRTGPAAAHSFVV